MKFCHADFARRLRAIFNHHPPQPWSARRLLEFFIAQSVMHSVGLFVLLVAAVVTVPAGWAYAFCQSATAIGAGESGTVREVLRRSLRAAVLWPKQNHLMLLILSVTRVVRVAQRAGRSARVALLAQADSRVRKICSRAAAWTFSIPRLSR